MISVRFLCHYPEMRVTNPFFLTPILLVHKMRVRLEFYPLVSPVMPAENLIDYRNDQAAAVIQQRAEHIIIRGIHSLHNIPPSAFCF